MLCNRAFVGTLFFRCFFIFFRQFFFTLCVYTNFIGMVKHCFAILINRAFASTRFFLPFFFGFKKALIFER